MRPESVRSAIAWVSVAYLITAGLGTWIAVNEGLVGRPFGWRLPLTPLSGFVFGLGTALSAPLVLLVALIATNMAMVSERQARRRGAGVTMVLGIGFFIGMLAEPITWAVLRSGAQGRLTTAVVIANLVLPVLLVFLASSLRRASRSSASAGLEEAGRR